MLADYTGEKFQTFCKTFVPPVKKCTLIFGQKGDVVSALEPDMEKLKKSEEWIIRKINSCQIMKKKLGLIIRKII